jgi:TM2 domain-containing membrane protein YozV
VAPPSEKSRAVALVLGGILGVFGAHRFYVGKAGTGLLMLLTAGGLGIWYLVDVIMIAAGAFRDAEGRLVTRWDAHEEEQLGVPREIMDEIYSLRHDVAELQERVDFAERLLSSKTGEPTRSGQDH